VPLSRAGATLTIAMTDPTNVFAMDDVKFMTGYNVEPVVASETAVLDSIDKYYGVSTGVSEKPKSGGPVVHAGEPGPSALEAAAKSLEDMPTMLDAAGADQVEVMEELEGDQRRDAHPAG
jgi:type IV pilus assembly protein PilB